MGRGRVTWVNFEKEKVQKHKYFYAFQYLCLYWFIYLFCIYLVLHTFESLSLKVKLENN